MPSPKVLLSGPSSRELLSGSAAALFQRFGYTHVSIRDITSSVNIPKGGFYNYFRSKEALASAILSQYFNALLEPLSRSLSDPAGARIRRYFASLTSETVRTKTSALQLISTLAAEAPALPPALARQIAEGLKRWSISLADLISFGQAHGQIDAEEDPDLLAALLINCWQGAMIRDKCDPSTQSGCLQLALNRILGRSRTDDY